MSSEDVFDSQLLDLHLGRLSPEQELDLRLRLAADARLAAQHEALATVFRALDTQRAAAAPPWLAARVAARVKAAGRPPRVVRPARDRAALADAAPVVLRLGSARDIVAAAAMIMLMVGFAVPSLLHMQGRAQRMGCSANLANLGMGMQQYAQTYNASLPFAGWGPRASWSPTGDPGAVVMPNRRHVYPLLRQAFIVSPRTFVCPARGGVPMPPEQVRQRDDFLLSDNVSYAYFNMAGARPSLQDDARLPIMADDNPMFDDGVPLFSRLGFGDRANLNSRAHGGAGQNILSLDGHVRWSTTPNAGVNADNIWTLRGVEVYTGREGPQTRDDAHLIK
jgi:hypothetical protein